MPITVADLNARLRVDARGVAPDLKAANAQLAGVAGTADQSASRAAGAFSRIGPAVRTSLTAGGAIIGGGLLAATGAATTLADEMANVATVVPTADLAGLTDQVQELSRASGQSTTDLTGGLYDLVSAGVSAEDAMGVLAASTNLAIGGLGTTAGAADVVTSAMNAYGLAADQAGGITDVFALAIQRGKVTADEIGSSIANVAPIAASAGIGLEEVGAAYGVLTAKGVPAAQATTQMRAAISALLTPNERLNKLQEQTGINFAELAEEKGLAVALEEMRASFAANGDAMAKLAGVAEDDFPSALAAMQEELGLSNSELERLQAVAGKDGATVALQDLAKMAGQSESGFAMALGSVEAYQFALGTTGENAGEFASQMGDYAEALEGSGVAAEQAAVKMDSPAEAGKRMLATFQTFMQDVGGPFASSLGPVVFALNQMGPAMHGIPRLATAAGGALGAMAGKALPMLTSGLTGLVPMLGGAVTSLVTGIGGLFAAAMPLLVAALPVLLIGAVVAAIAVLVLNEDIRNAVFGFVGGILEWIGEGLGKIGAFLGSVVSNVVGFFGNLLGAAGQALGSLVGSFLQAGASILETIGNAIGSVVSTILSIPGRIVSWIGSVAGQAASAAGQFLSNIANGVGRVVSTILGIPGRVAGIIGDLAGVAWDAVTGFVNMFLGLPGKIVGIVGDAIAGAAGMVGDFLADPLGSVGNFVGGLIPSFQEGTLSAPGGLAMLHPGEMVIPPDLSESFRRFLGAPGPSATTSIQETSSSETNVTVVLPGATRPMGPEDVARPLRRLAALGSLPTYGPAG